VEYHLILNTPMHTCWLAGLRGKVCCASRGLGWDLPLLRRWGHRWVCH